MAVQLQEMDDRVTFLEQLEQDSGPVVLINKFNVAPEDAERLLEAWADDAAFMKQRPGFISTLFCRADRAYRRGMGIAAERNQRW
jgi:hypothetical protein